MIMGFLKIRKFSDALAVFGRVLNSRKPKRGRRFGYYITGDIVCVVCIIFGVCFIGGEEAGIKECFGSWYNWILAVYSSKLEALMGTYLTSAAHSHANDYNLHEGTVIGKFNGEFWGMFACHQLVGNLMTLAVLRDEKGGSTSGTTLLLILFLCSMTLGTILMCFLSKRNGKEERLQESPVSFSSSIGSLLKSILILLLDVRILLVIPLIAYSGLQQAFVWAEYTKELSSLPSGNVALVVQWLSMEFLMLWSLDNHNNSIRRSFNPADRTALASGKLQVDSPSTFVLMEPKFQKANYYFKTSKVIFLADFAFFFSVSGGLLASLLPLVIGALWGIGDGVLNTQLSALLGILFKHDLEGAFAQLKLWQSVSIAVVFFVSTSISLQTMVMILLVALCISVAGFLFLTLKVEKAFSYRAA
ncbi:UNC93-like protein 3 [Sesamum angolense]|uniref:UNC93-like protein 3 n=1 Tax=Sesamum angolense TaxID=2727404 RepID=A0AAE1WMZ7_9LAMI|nr:UNC93-like protein 3 [Sesamum angolense]